MAEHAPPSARTIAAIFVAVKLALIVPVALAVLLTKATEHLALMQP